jgi:hypothetical protein
LKKSKPDHATSSDATAAGSRYAYKASLIGAAHEFELTEDGLRWQAGSKSGVLAYKEIAAIRLSYRPVSMQSRRFRADIESRGGRRIVILSTSWQTVALMATQDHDYREFVTRLHERMQQAGSKALLIGGIGPKTHGAGVVLLALVGIAVAGLLLRAIVTGEFAGGLFLVGFAVLFTWQVGGFIRRNRPGSYTFDQLPQPLLP